MSRSTLAPLGLMLVLLAAAASAPAVPPPLARATHLLPEGALMGLAEDAARLETEVGAPSVVPADVGAGAAPPDAAARDRLDDGLPVEPEDAVGRQAPSPVAAFDTTAFEPTVDEDPELLDDGLPADAALPEAVDTTATPPVEAQTAPSSGTGSPQPSPGLATQVQVPVRLDLAFMERVITEQVLDADGNVRFDIDEGGCNTLVLSEPVLRFSPPNTDEPAGIRMRMLARARFGLLAFGRCTGVADWVGQVEVLQTPHVLAGGGGFGLGVAGSQVFDADGEPSAAGVLWDWIKSRVQPRLSTVRVDLRGALGELRGMLSKMLVRQTAEGLLAVLESVRVTDAIAAEGGVTVSLRMSAPVAVAAPAPAPLSALELARFREALADLDAFFTFVARTVAGPSLNEQTRDALLATLIDGRYRLLDAIDAGEHGDEVVRGLFVDLWSSLAPLLAALPGELPGEQGLRYLAFIAAGDALRALQSLGPGTGLDISADGLRRLARLIAPDTEGDPLRSDDAVDEDLRRRFGFGAPLPPPALRPEPEPAPEPEPDVWLWPLEWLLPSAHAEVGGVAGELGSRLNGWVPASAELPEYLALVRDLLDAVVAAEYEAGKLPSEVRAVYRTLILATAWQESCWRQFVREAGAVTTLRSAAGALGLMQVSRHVWRGFYDVDGLARDIAYNARAGAEIARHYLVDYALAAGEERHEGGMDNLARATYAAYNGGPRQLGRYRKSETPSRLRAVDKAFLAKFEAVKGGDDLAVASCYGGS